MSSKQEEQDPYLTVEQAAGRLKLKPNTLDRWRHEGRGPTFRVHGRRIVYHVDDLEEWSKSNARTTAKKYRPRRSNSPSNSSEGEA